MWARNIDSRSRTAKQLRFKSALVPIRLFQNPIPQLLYGDFCNTIPPKADKIAGASVCPLCADFVAEVAEEETAVGAGEA
jgi:hypothetical protein